MANIFKYNQILQQKSIFFSNCSFFDKNIGHRNQLANTKVRKKIQNRILSEVENSI